jgi:hypothetical protein
LKETRPLWPPQRGVGLREPNLGKTNPRVTLFICLRFVLRPLPRTRFFITNANPACSCVYICEFQFRPIHPPSRRLSPISLSPNLEAEAQPDLHPLVVIIIVVVTIHVRGCLQQQALPLLCLVALLKSIAGHPLLAGSLLLLVLLLLLLLCSQPVRHSASRVFQDQVQGGLVPP